MTPAPAAVAVTGVGFVTSIGVNRLEVETSLRQLRSGIRRWSPTPDMPLPVRVAGLVPGYDLDSVQAADWSWPEQAGVHEAEVRAMPPQGVYALAALREAMKEAGLTQAEVGTGSTGLFTASAGSPRLLHHHLGRMEASRWRRIHPHAVISSIAGSLNFHLASLLHVRGASCGFTAACASGSHALGFAIDEIRLGRQERMLVVAAEELSLETVIPFAGLGALSAAEDPARASRPFDVLRDGFVPTAGGVALILESPASAQKRGAPVRAWLRGWGHSGDGHHAVIPEPSGDGLFRAMHLALRDAGLTPADIDHVNAHATSTPAGDRAEATALRQLFSGHQPAVSSTKALTGHGLSMAGLMEAAFSVLCLEGGFIPGQANLEQPDEACRGLRLPAATLSHPPRAIMNNSSGFGGANVVHILTPNTHTPTPPHHD